MDEQIIAIDRKFLFEDEKLAFQGLLTDGPMIKYFMKKFRNYIEVRRGDAEVNEAWKQPIPYTIIRRGEDVFVYKRLKEGGEERLHDQLSIGVGGHMNRLNDVRNWETNLISNLVRELIEEIEIEVKTFYELEPQFVGLINDDNEEVGKVHIGILAIVDLPQESEVTVRETDTLEGYWIRIRDLKKSPLFEGLETWSQYAVEVL